MAGLGRRRRGSAVEPRSPGDVLCGRGPAHDGGPGDYRLYVPRRPRDRAVQDAAGQPVDGHAQSLRRVSGRPPLRDHRAGDRTPRVAVYFARELVAEPAALRPRCGPATKTVIAGPIIIWSATAADASQWSGTGSGRRRSPRRTRVPPPEPHTPSSATSFAAWSDPCL